jgi:phosphoribosylaminoimidazole carboxylase (NCAIR synthetase)
VHVHAYGKAGRPGRKVGHATIVGTEREVVDAMAARVLALPAASQGDWSVSG